MTFSVYAVWRVETVALDQRVRETTVAEARTVLDSTSVAARFSSDRTVRVEDRVGDQTPVQSRL